MGRLSCAPGVRGVRQRPVRHRSADCSAARRLSPGYAVHAEPSGHGASTEHPRNPRAREDGRFASTACALCPAHGHGDAGDGAFAGPGRARTGPAARPRRKRDTYSVQPKAKQRERGGGTGAQDRQLRAAGAARLCSGPRLTAACCRLDPDERPKRWGGDVRILYAVCARTATVL